MANTDYQDSDKVLGQKYWPTGDPNDITIGVIFDFSETVYENQYRKFTDLLSMLGGQLATLYTILWVVSPIATLYFLLHLAFIISEKTGKQYRSELNNLTSTAM